MAIDPRDQRIADLEALVSKLLARVEEQDKRIAALEAENRELKARLNQNSTNSSKPPSSDPPGAPRSPKPPTGRRPGGQPGHKPHKRELVPPERVDHFVDLPAPEQCSKCEQTLAGRPVEPLRHQMVEVPPIMPDITEFRCDGGTCGGCGAVTCSGARPIPAG